MADELVIAGRAFRSRLIVGTGKYRSFQEMARAHAASGADMVTVAVRRVNLTDKSKESLLDYIDRGASLVSIRGYDTLNDVRDYGRHLLPLIRQELAHRRATAQRGSLQHDYPGNYAPEYAALASSV